MNMRNMLNMNLEKTMMQLKLVEEIDLSDEEILKHQFLINVSYRCLPNTIYIICWNEKNTIVFANTYKEKTIIKHSDSDLNEAWIGFIKKLCNGLDVSSITSLQITAIGPQKIFEQRSLQKIFIDESGNTGSVTISNDNQLNFTTQPKFAMGAVLIYNETDEKNIIEKYRKFKNEFEIDDVIKGSDMLTRRNNKLLEYFIDNVLDDEHFFVNVYDKKFYLATQLIMGLYGSDFHKNQTILYYDTSSKLSFENDEFFTEYCKFVTDPTTDNFKKYLYYLSQHIYVQLPLVNVITDAVNYIIYNNLIEDLKNNFLTYGWYSDPNVINLINQNSISEILVSLYENKQLTEKTEIIHDSIEQFEKVLSDEFRKVNVNLKFYKSKDSELIQLADNIASISYSLFSRVITHFTKKEEWKENSEWDMKTMSKFMRKISSMNIKFTVPSADWATSLCVRDMFSESYPPEQRNNRGFNEKYRAYLKMIIPSPIDHDYDRLINMFEKK